MTQPPQIGYCQSNSWKWPMLGCSCRSRLPSELVSMNRPNIRMAAAAARKASNIARLWP